jgi:hypothetical protein
MELTREEVDALIEYHRTQQYEAARREDYHEAEYYKNRAAEWARELPTVAGGNTLSIVGVIK